MARGFLGGFVVGAVVSVTAAAIISVYAGPPLPPEVDLVAPEGREAPLGGVPITALDPRLTEGYPQRPAAANLEAPGTADGLTMGDVAMRPLAPPDTTTDAPGSRGPAPAAEPGGVAVERLSPIRPRAQVPAPGVPDTDTGATIATEPPRPSGSGLSSPQPMPRGTGLEAPAGDGAEGPVAPEADTSVAGIAGAPAPGAPGQPDEPAVFADTAPRPETAPPRMALAPSNPDAPEAATADPESQPSDTRSLPDGATPPAMAPPDSSDLAEDLASSGNEAGSQDSRAGTDTGPRNDNAPASAPGSAGPSIGTPATSLLGRRAGDAEPPAGDAVDPAAEPDTGLSALRRNAEPFDNPGGQPLMSIILMDTGQDLEGGPIGLAALGSFPHPLSFAVDTSLPDAAERAARYRELGFEVMALVDLPRNLTASDTEVALGTLIGRVPDAVAVLEGPGTGLQGSPEMARQVGAILRETGHGIVWRPAGLDAAQRNAARGGVASRTLYRDFDSDDQSPIVIRRFLDQAAFRAGQEGSVITVGRVRADTISALVIWGLQDRVRRVAVAPVSAVLTEDQGG